MTLYYVAFQCGCKNIFRKIWKKNLPTESWENHWLHFRFIYIFYPTISCIISARDHPFKTPANFQEYLLLSPPIGSFYATIRQQIWQICDPSPLKNTEILNAWSNGYQNITWSLHLNDTSIFSTLWSKTGHLKYFSGSKLPSLGPLSLILGPWITFGYLYIGRTPWKRHEVVLY